jgi:micrococcal nuclease
MDLWWRNVKLVRVVDGDTVDLEVDLGFRIKITERFRLANINAPEMKTPEGPKAKEALTTILTAPGTSLVIRSMKPIGTDLYGRWLAEIYATNKDSTVSVNEHMVKSGFAVPFMVHK